MMLTDRLPLIIENGIIAKLDALGRPDRLTLPQTPTFRE
jgi:hypothetical protein